MLIDVETATPKVGGHIIASQKAMKKYLPLSLESYNECRALFFDQNLILGLNYLAKKFRTVHLRRCN